MAFDAHTNLAVSTIATAPAPATSGTTLTVAVGEGARFPVAPFNATVWPATAIPTPVNAEVVRVTARTGDVLTITRAQEATTARSIVAGDLVAATITAKTITDIESGVNFPLIQLPNGSVGSPTLAFSDPGLGVYRLAPNAMAFASGGGVPAFIDPLGLVVSALKLDTGNTDTVLRRGGPSQLLLTNNSASDFSMVQFGGTTNAFPALKRSGAGLAVRLANDSGNADLTAGGATFTGTVFCGATPPNPSYIALLQTGQFRMALAGASGLAGDFFTSGTAVLAGSIALSGGTTAYNTTSDVRLKTDHGRHHDPEVLRRTIVHNFTWDHDGLPGRGVFAQEAVSVAPFAVTVGTDERDDEGHLKQPWGVDYSKYVPDLITGWQSHDERLAALERLANSATILTITGDAETRFAPPPPPHDYVRRGMSSIWHWFAAIWRKPSWVG